MIKQKEKDLRHPVLIKVGCYYRGSQVQGFEFFNKNTKIKDNDVFVFNEGMLWKVKK